MSKMNTAMSGAAAGGSVGGPWGAAIGGVAGFMMGKDDKSGEAYAQLMREVQGIPLPILKEYYPELYQQVVSLNPEIETAVELGPSKMEGVATDPALRQAQLNALSKLQGIGDAGGRDAQFLSDASRMENDINTNLQGQQGAIEQNLATRGLSGGGTELVSKSIAAQNASNRAAQMGMDLNAQAQQRALQAIMSGGQMGGQMQAQDFGQQAQKAQASDSINKFNAANRQQVMNNNVNTANNAQQWNAQSAQSTANQNTGLNNSSQLYNQGLAQQQYDNQLKKYGIVSNTGIAQANNQQNQAKDQNQFIGNMISAGSTAYAANNKKKDEV